MRKLQVWAWFISGFFQKHKKILLLGLILGIVLSIFAIWIFPHIPRPNPVKKIGLIGQYQRSQLPISITSRISQGLTAILDDGSPVEMICEKWEISEDGKVYAFYLRDNIFWQDGEAIKSSDFDYQFEDVEVETIDDKTILFKLKQPYAPFPLLLAKPIMKKGDIGTGEYILKQIREKSNIVQEISLEGKYNNLKIKFYPNINAAKTAFELGEIDELQDLYLNPYLDEDIWQSKIEVESAQKTNQHIALFLNNNDPLFKDNKSFRQALAYATQKPIDSTRAMGPISMISWAYNQDLKPYDYNAKRALDLSEKAFGNLAKVKEVSLKISTTTAFLELAESIKNNWQEVLGISVEIEVINAIAPNYQILLTSQEIPSDPDQYSLWHSTQAQNIINLKSPRIDKLLEDGRRESDPQKRRDYYYDFQKYFVEESPVIFLHYPETYTIERKNWVKDFVWKIIQLGRLQEEV
jgi:peptide/nickel transport system substrate-binding protein